MEEFKDRRLKYVELPNVFKQKASEIDITHKQHLRACEKLAAHLAKQKPSNPKEFEQNEWLKDFVIKSADLNEKTIALLDFLRQTIQEISNDSKELMQDGQILDRLRDQSDALTMAWGNRDKAINDLYESRKGQFRKDQAAA
jgi:hypothetical protein